MSSRTSAEADTMSETTHKLYIKTRTNTTQLIQMIDYATISTSVLSSGSTGAGESGQSIGSGLAVLYLDVEQLVRMLQPTVL